MTASASCSNCSNAEGMRYLLEDIKPRVRRSFLAYLHATSRQSRCLFLDKPNHLRRVIEVYIRSQTAHLPLVKPNQVKAEHPVGSATRKQMSFGLHARGRRLYSGGGLGFDCKFVKLVFFPRRSMQFMTERADGQTNACKIQD